MITPDVPDERAPLTRREARALENATAGSTTDSRTRSKTVSGARSTAREMVRTSRRRAGRASLAAQLKSTMAMVFAAALLVGVTVPAEAFRSDAAAELPDLPQSTSAVGQTVAVSELAASAAAARDTYTYTSYAQLLRERYGKVSTTFRVTTGVVRWPFPYAVPIGDRFGTRVAPCGGCSTQHSGVDFNPGAGTPIYAIADGIVTQTEDGSSELGNHVTIEHQINGKTVRSVYAHMARSSSPLRVGDAVAVGDFVGLVGNTGQSTGPHLHLEIRVNDELVDPFAWLTANAVN